MYTVYVLYTYLLFAGHCRTDYIRKTKLMEHTAKSAPEPAQENHPIQDKALQRPGKGWFQVPKVRLHRGTLFHCLKRIISRCQEETRTSWIWSSQNGPGNRYIYVASVHLWLPTTLAKPCCTAHKVLFALPNLDYAQYMNGDMTWQQHAATAWEADHTWPASWNAPTCSLPLLFTKPQREGEREREREGGREGGRERERGREGGRERKEGGSEPAHTHKHINKDTFVEGSLEVKLPTIWTDGQAEVERIREEKGRREKIREEKER